MNLPRSINSHGPRVISKGLICSTSENFAFSFNFLRKVSRFGPWIYKNLPSLGHLGRYKDFSGYSEKFLLRKTKFSHFKLKSRKLNE
jgi:hypothetical protein